MKESLFQKKATKWLENKGAYCIKYNASGISRTGVPDYICCLKGVFLAIEFKKDIKSKPSELQKYNIKKINDAGGIAIVLRPETFDIFQFEIKVFLLDKTNDSINTCKRKLLERIGYE